MKKMVLILVSAMATLFATTVQAQQYDTLPYNVGVPQFFIKNPLDSMHCIVDENSGITFNVPNLGPLAIEKDVPLFGAMYTVYDSIDYATGFYPDSTLTLVGVAWWTYWPWDYLIHHCNTDSLSLRSWDSCEVRLYEPEGEDMILRVDKRAAFDTLIISRVYAETKGWSEVDRRYIVPCSLDTLIAPVYEVYFDREITLSDSFYISVKHIAYKTGSDTIEILDYTKGWFESFHNTAYNNYDTVRRFPVQSYRVQERQGGPWRYGEIHCYPLLFPIIRRACDTCPEIQGLRWSRLGSGTTAFVQWDAGTNHRDWQLCYGPSGTPVGEGTVVDCPPAQCVLPGLAAGQTYDVYVRARCRFARDEWTGWSGPLEIGFGNPGEGIDGVEGIHAELTPNPATGRVRVSCGEALRRVEVYDLQGRRCLAQEAQGTEAELDISVLAAGRYTVLVHTAEGTGAKALVVR